MGSKLAVAWLAMAVAIVAGSATSCSIDHRSEQFACEKPSDCDGGRTCIDNFCVFTTAPIDAPDNNDPDAPKRPDAPPNPDCPPNCTSCNKEEMQCTIDCQNTDCNAQIVCPTGWNCNILCTEQNNCRNGVNCLQAASCNIECSGSSACRNVACGTGKCEVSCTGMQSCRSVSCGQSCACDVTCAEGSSCETVICSSFQCDSIDGGCSSAPLGCNVCP